MSQAALQSLERRVGGLEQKDAVHDVEMGITRALYEKLAADTQDCRTLAIANSGELRYQRQILESVASKLGVEVAGFRTPSDDSLIRQLSELQRQVRRRTAPKRTAKDWAKFVGAAIAALTTIGLALKQLADTIAGSSP